MEIKADWLIMIVFSWSFTFLLLFYTKTQWNSSHVSLFFHFTEGKFRFNSALFCIRRSQYCISHTKKRIQIQVRSPLYAKSSGGPRPLNKRGLRSARLWDKPGVGGNGLKKFSRDFGPKFGLKIRGGGSPGLPPWIRRWSHLKIAYLVTRLSSYAMFRRVVF